MDVEVTEVLKNNVDETDRQNVIEKDVTYMTMTELLAKRTMYEKQIKQITDGDDRTLRTVNFVVLKKKSSDTTIDGLKADYVRNNIKSNYDKLVNLIHNYELLTSVKNGVNATVKVQVTDTAIMTIAEALGYLNPTVKSYYEDMINKLTRDLTAAQKKINEYNDKTFSTDAINVYIATVLAGNVDKGIDPKRLTEITDQYHANNDLEFIDPINIADTLSGMRKFYTEFYTRVNFALSEANAKTRLWVNFHTCAWEIVEKPIIGEDEKPVIGEDEK